MSNRSATGVIKVAFQGDIKNTLDNGNQVAHTIGGSQVVNQRFSSSGVSEDEFNRGWASENRSLSSSGSESFSLYNFATIDIGAGAGEDALGQALTLEEIVGILIVHVSGEGQLEIIPSALQGWSPIGSHTAANGGALRAGGCLLKMQPHTSGFDVANGSSHNITLTANGGAVVYSIYVLGRHDDDESSSSSLSSSSSTSSLSSSSSSTSSSQSSSSSTSLSSTSSLSSSSTSSLSSSSSSTSSLSSSSST